MRTDAHFPGLDSCACRPCITGRRVKRVTNKLLGIKPSKIHLSEVASYQDYLFRHGVIVSEPRLAFVLAGFGSTGNP